MSEWPLVGRLDDVALLRRWLSDPECRGALIVGPAGVGKSRLAREFEQLARAADTETAWAVATRSASALPFGAMATLMPDIDEAYIRRARDRSEFLRRSALAMLETTRGRRLVIVVDDAHLLDDASATLLHQLALNGGGFVLATIRSGEPVPDPITALWRDGLAERIDLEGLGTESIEELLSLVLGGQVDPLATQQFATRCEGNVLFLKTLVTEAMAEDVLRQEAGVWYLARPLSPSRHLIELVESQLRLLGEEERKLLEVVSFGEPLTAEELCCVGDPAVAENLERLGMLTSKDSDGRLEFRLAHPLYGDVLRKQMPRLRLRDVARQLSAVAQHSDRPDDVLRAAIWGLEFEGVPAETMTRAASLARWRYEFELAERLAHAAVRLGGGFAATLLVAQLARLRGRPGGAESQFAALSESATSDEELGRVTVNRLDNAVHSMGDVAAGLAIAREALARITDPFWRDEVEARRVGALLTGQGPAQAFAPAMALRERAKGTAWVYASLGFSRAMLRSGQIESGLEISRSAYEEHRKSPEVMEWPPWIHLFVSCDGLAAAGRFTEAEALATSEYERGRAEGSPEALAWFNWSLADSVGARGDTVTAARRARESLVLFRQLGMAHFGSLVAVPLALALTLAGEPDEAVAVLDDAKASRGASVLAGVERVVTLAWIAAGQGELPAARELFEEAVALGESIGDVVGTAKALHGLVRIGHAAESHERLVALADRSDSPLLATQASHARALAHSDSEALLAIAATFDGMGAYLLAAEAAADAAVAKSRTGDKRSAAAAERQAGVYRSRCEVVLTPSLRPVGPRATLTKAERETALLASAGYTNRQIAERQFLSIRTVQNRLQRIYTKLGVDGREELKTVLEA